MAGGQADYSYLIDWTNDGDYSDTGEDVSARLNADPVAIKYGRDSARALSPTAPGEASFTLNNDSRDYSPDNSSSPLVGKVLSGRPVRITATLSAVTYTLIEGFIDDFALDPQSKTASFTVADTLARLIGQHVSTGVYWGLRTGDAIGTLLDAVGWPAGARDLDRGATVLPLWWAEGDAGDELAKLVNSEGSPAFVTVDPNGNFVFRDRHHRLIRTASLTSQVTIRVTGSGTTSPLASWPLGYDHGASAVINAATFSVARRAAQGELSAVWTSDDTINVTSSATVEVSVETSDPFWGAVTPVIDIDFTETLGGGTPEITLSRTSGVVTTIRIKAVGGAVRVNNLQLRAYSVPVTSTVKVAVEDTASIGIYGRRSWPTEAPWAGIHDARALAELVVSQRGTRRPTVTPKLVNYDATTLTQQLARDLSDRITIVDAETGLNDDFFIEQIAHGIHGAGERVHETTFACEQAPSQVADVFVLGSATRGVLGTNRLGRDGLDDPATVFVLGSATNGVLGTNLLGL